MDTASLPFSPACVRPGCVRPGCVRPGCVRPGCVSIEAQAVASGVLLPAIPCREHPQRRVRRPPSVASGRSRRGRAPGPRLLRVPSARSAGIDLGEHVTAPQRSRIGIAWDPFSVHGTWYTPPLFADPVLRGRSMCGQMVNAEIVRWQGRVPGPRPLPAPAATH